MKNKIQTIKMVNIFSNQYEVEFILMLEKKCSLSRKIVRKSCRRRNGYVVIHVQPGNYFDGSVVNSY